MEKKMNKIEELNEEVKVEELTEETLDEVDGGIITVAAAEAALLTVRIVTWGAPYAWKAGQWIGKQIVGH